MRHALRALIPLSLALLAACGPTTTAEQSIATAVAQTVVAQAPVATAVPTESAATAAPTAATVASTAAPTQPPATSQSSIAPGAEPIAIEGRVGEDAPVRYELDLPAGSVLSIELKLAEGAANGIYTLSRDGDASLATTSAVAARRSASAACSMATRAGCTSWRSRATRPIPSRLRPPSSRTAGPQAMRAIARRRPKSLPLALPSL